MCSSCWCSCRLHRRQVKNKLIPQSLYKLLIFILSDLIPNYLPPYPSPSLPPSLTTSLSPSLNTSIPFPNILNSLFLFLLPFLCIIFANQKRIVWIFQAHFKGHVHDIFRLFFVKLKEWNRVKMWLCEGWWKNTKKEIARKLY